MSLSDGNIFILQNHTIKYEPGCSRNNDTVTDWAGEEENNAVSGL